MLAIFAVELLLSAGARGYLHVDYLLPTPLGPDIEVRAQVEEIKGRKTILVAEVIVEGKVTAKGRVVAVRMPEHLQPDTV